MRIEYQSDKGMKRSANQDYIYVNELENIYLIADGIGGQNAGDVASKLAVESAYSYISEHIRTDDISEVLLRGFQYTHEVVRKVSLTKQEWVGMGTTLLSMYLRNRDAIICHVGDSRAYVFRNKLSRVTTDHTVAEFLKNQRLSFQSDRKHGNVLLQAIGGSTPIKPEVKVVEVQEQDIILLCTDGLSDMLSDLELETIIRENMNDIKAMSQTLVSEANLKGGKDNISLILLKEGPEHLVRDLGSDLLIDI